MELGAALIPEDPQFKPHAGIIKMAQVLGSPVYIYNKRMSV